MKITRAYTIDKETLDILRKKPNKSQFVCKAVKRFDKSSTYFDLSDVITKRMLNCLVSRSDVSPQLKALIEIELWG